MRPYLVYDMLAESSLSPLLVPLSVATVVLRSCTGFLPHFARALNRHVSNARHAYSRLYCGVASAYSSDTTDAMPQLYNNNSGKPRPKQDDEEGKWGDLLHAQVASAEYVDPLQPKAGEHLYAPPSQPPDGD
jgi:hypothetical protein